MNCIHKKHMSETVHNNKTSNKKTNVTITLNNETLHEEGKPFTKK